MSVHELSSGADALFLFLEEGARLQQEERRLNVQQ